MPKVTDKPRGVEERVSYAVGHRVRAEVLAALNERDYSKAELARIVRQPLSLVTHHVDELFKDGSIEVAKTEPVRAIMQNWYRAIAVAFFTDQEMAELTYEQRQEFYGVILQASMAEAISSFWSGAISDDPRTFMAWRWFNVDNQGRAEIADEQLASWKRIQEIEARSGERCVQSGEEPTSIIVTSLSYPRSRSTPHPPGGLQSEDS